MNCSRCDELLDELTRTRDERDRYREHSVQLNSLGFALAEAVGDVGSAEDRVESSEEVRMARLSRLVAMLAAAREDASERRWERDHANLSYQRVRDELGALQAKFYALPADVRGSS